MSKELDKLIEQILSEKFELPYKQRKGTATSRPFAKRGDVEFDTKNPEAASSNQSRHAAIQQIIKKLDTDKNNTVDADEIDKGESKLTEYQRKVLKAILVWAIQHETDLNSLEDLEKLLGVPGIYSKGLDTSGGKPTSFKLDTRQDPKAQPKWAQEITPNLRDLIAKQKREFHEITTTDFIEALRNSKNVIHFEVVMLLDKLETLAERSVFDPDTNAFFKEEIPKLLKNVDRYDADNIKLGGGDRALPTIPISGRYMSKFGGQTPQLLQQIFAQAGVSGDSITQKMKAINTLSKAITKQNIGTRSIEQNLSAAIVVDYLRKIVQDYEASAGGFLFENFLALLLGGTKEGGNIRIEDFTWPKGKAQRTQYGSAKLYKEGTTKYGGSKKLFSLLYERGIREITYVLAMKGESLNKIKVFLDFLILSEEKGQIMAESTKTGASVDVTYIEEKSKRPKGWEAQAKFPWPAKAIASIDLGLESEQQAEQDKIVKEFLNKAGTDIGNVISMANNFMVGMTDTFTKPIDFNEPDSVDGKLISYGKTMENFLELRKLVLSSFQGLQGGQYETGVVADPTKGQTAQKAAAEKLQESTSLDQLIEAVVKGMLDETK